ncbi:MAG: hypothetical protein SGJ27_09020 [Candidatus Melainabacteria bacterium]|nr:hypothetical protein [Candidatus Melainabacteria bacterium]
MTVRVFYVEVHRAWNSVPITDAPLSLVLFGPRLLNLVVGFRFRSAFLFLWTAFVWLALIRGVARLTRSTARFACSTLSFQSAAHTLQKAFAEAPKKFEAYFQHLPDAAEHRNEYVLDDIDINFDKRIGFDVSDETNNSDQEDWQEQRR